MKWQRWGWEGVLFSKDSVLATYIIPTCRGSGEERGERQAGFQVVPCWNRSFCGRVLATKHCGCEVTKGEHIDRSSSSTSSMTLAATTAPGAIMGPKAQGERNFCGFAATGRARSRCRSRPSSSGRGRRVKRAQVV